MIPWVGGVFLCVVSTLWLKRQLVLKKKEKAPRHLKKRGCHPLFGIMGVCVFIVWYVYVYRRGSWGGNSGVSDLTTVPGDWCVCVCACCVLCVCGVSNLIYARSVDRSTPKTLPVRTGFVNNGSLTTVSWAGV